MMKKIICSLLLLLGMSFFSSKSGFSQPDACWSWMIGNTGFENVIASTVDSSDHLWIGGSYEGTVDFDPGPATFELNSGGVSASYLASYDETGAFRFALSMPGFQFLDMDASSSGDIYMSGYH